MHNAHSCRSPGVLSYQHATCKTAHGCPVYVCICVHIVLQLCTSMNTCKPVSQFGMLDVEVIFFLYFLSVASWEVSFMEPCIRQGSGKGGCSTLSMRSFQILHHQHRSKHLQRPAGPTVDKPIVPTWFQRGSNVVPTCFNPTVPTHCKGYLNSLTAKISDLAYEFDAERVLVMGCLGRIGAGVANECWADESLEDVLSDFTLKICEANVVFHSYKWLFFVMRPCPSLAKRFPSPFFSPKILLFPFFNLSAQGLRSNLP